MIIQEAMCSGKPFYHCDMIGAYMMIGEDLVHHDNIENYDDMDFITESVHSSHTEWCKRTLSVNCILRDDWNIVE